MEKKWKIVLLLALAELLAMGLWFSASAVTTTLTSLWNLNSGQVAWLTMAVTVGFVAGSFLSALTNVSDIYPARIVFAMSAFFGAAATALITVSGGYTPALILRFLTGFALAGVYPVGMKMMATWMKEDRGMGLGLLTGALVIGTASPHLIRALGGTDNWQFALYVAAALAALGGIIVLWVGELGPVFGIWAMRSLKQSSAAARLAGGRG